MTFLDILLNFLIGLITSVIGILIVLWIERNRRPSLVLSVGKPSLLDKDDPLGRPQVTWLHIRVHNQNMPNWLSPVYSRDPALMCRAWITFHHLDDGLRVFDREMNARWSETLEPIIETKDTPKGKLGSFVNVQTTVDIPPGEYTTIDVVNRFRGEDNCYGWNNESYIYNWKHFAWKLDKGRYIIRARIKTGGREFTNSFLLVNDVEYEDFRLESLPIEMKKKLRL
jgi:hypothetical protein